MDTVLRQFLADLICDADLAVIRPEIREKAAQLLAEDIALRSLRLDIGDDRPAAHC